MFAIPAPLRAQTVHFSGAQSALGSGFLNPGGVAVDASGNLYIADTGNSQILKETLAAGTYTQSVVITGLSNPQGVAVGASGNLYIADTGNSRVLLETLSAGSYTGSTVGTGLLNPQGVAVDASGNVYIADTGNTQVLIETLSGGIYTQSTVASGLRHPQGVAVDGRGNVYIADGGAPPGRLVVETLSSGTYTQSTQGSGLSSPGGVAVDASRAVYVADTGNSRVLKILPSAANFGSVNVLSTSSVVSMTFTFDTGGRLGFTFVFTQGAMGQDYADALTGTCDTNGSSHNYNAGDSCTIDMTFSPRFPGIRYGAAVLLGAFPNVLATGLAVGTGLGPEVTFVPGTLNTIDRALVSPYGIAVDPRGNVFVTDQGAGILYEENFSKGVYGRTTISTDLRNDTGVAVDGAGDLYVASLLGTVNKETFSPFLGYTETTIISGHSTLDGIAVDGSGNLYIADFVDSLAFKETLQPDGTLVETTIGSGLNGPTGIAVDATGNVFISNDSAGTVFKETLQPNGTYTQTTAISGLRAPESVVIDNNGNLYVADTSAQTIYKESLQPDGSYVQSTIATSLPRLWWIAVDQQGNLYVSQKTSIGAESVINVTTPAALTFQATRVGSVSADSPQTVTLSNIGNTPLTFPAPASSTNPSVSRNFTLNGTGQTACPLVNSGAGSAGTVAAGGSCQLAISFAPSDAGGDFGSVVLTDTNLNASGPSYVTQTISLTGVGIALPASQLQLTGVPTTIGAGGNLGTVTVLAENSLGIVVTTSTASVTVTVTGPNGYSQMVTAAAVNGVASLNLNSLVLAVPGTYTVTATSSGLSPSTSTVTVTASAHLDLTGVPMTVASGGNLGTIAVSVEGSNGAVATSSTASITVTITGPNNYSQMVTAPAVNGVASLNLSSLVLSVPGTYTVTATSPGIAPETSTVTVSASLTTTTTALSVSANPVPAGQSVTFTATISPTPGGSSPGTVNFYNGATLLGNGSLNSGVATLSSASLPVGADSITAVYSGNAAFGTSTSSALTETITAAYNVTAPAAPVTAAEGSAVTIGVTVSAFGGSFNNVVTMSATGLPAGATATFSPPMVTPGATGAPTMLTIQLLSATAAGVPAGPPTQIPFLPLSAAIALCCFGFAYRSSTPRIIKSALVLASFVIIGGVLAACNGGFAGKPGTLPGNYTITITGTSGALQRSTTVTLVVP